MFISLKIFPAGQLLIGKKVFFPVSASCERVLRNSISKAREKGIAPGFQGAIPWNPPQTDYL